VTPEKALHFANLIRQYCQATQYQVAMSEYEALAVGFGVMPKHLLAYDRNSGAPEDPQHMS
jgi:hypothetical protein